MIVTDKDKLVAECKDVSVLEAKPIIDKLIQELSASRSGVGLAANQIGIDAKVCIIRAGHPINLVNPKIVDKFGKALFRNEGCLSFPGQWITTARYNEIVVKDALHPNGFICTGFEAVAVQHEIDHLYGRTMFDYLIAEPEGRNSPCWCGSNRKYKKCCLGKEIKIG